MLLICMISFTGFSTTTDLNQNSDAVTITDYDVGSDIVAAIVVIKANFLLSEQSPILHCEHYSDLININKKIEAKPESYLGITLKEQFTPPLTNSRNDFKINKLPDLKNKTANVFMYRCARDGIDCNLS